MSRGLRVAYLTTRYPSLSHTFILREVDALRRRGVDVRTISMHRAAAEHLLSPENREAERTTFSVRPARARDVLAAHRGALLAHPLAYFKTLRQAFALAAPGVKGRPLWQLFHFAEAIVVWTHCVKLELRHVHAHHGSAPADVALLAACYGAAAGAGPRSFSLTLHGPDELRDVHWFGLAEKIRRAEAVACISEFARSQLMALVEEAHWRKLRVVHCGVVPGDYAHLGETSHAARRILCVGRLVAEKGHAVLLAAVASLVRDGHDVEAVIVGSGPLRERLERLAEELRVADRVVFRGPLGQAEVSDCYAAASLFCSASFAEGVPVVLMEAMAAGRPVVATAVAGVRELVRDGDTGLLVAPGSAEELSAAIAVLLANPELGARLADAGRAYVAREYDVDRSAGVLVELFSEILDASPEHCHRASEPLPRPGDGQGAPAEQAELEPASGPVAGAGRLAEVGSR